jgi:4-amino-4-deoxy-L-arabinose transferase-like glycosyltransferase
MEYQIVSICVMVMSALLCGYAWRCHSRGRDRWAILLLMLAGFVLRLFTAADMYLHPWDEVYHALVAKHLILHPVVPTLYDQPLLPYNYQSWTCNHVWLHKQPMALWGMAFSMFLFGVNEIALRLPSVLFTTIGIWMTYYIGKHLLDRRVGFIAAFLYTIQGLIIEMSAGRDSTDHIDVAFMFYVGLGVAASVALVRRGGMGYHVLIVASIAAAILSKWLQGLIIFPIWFLILWQSGQYSMRTLLWYGIAMGIAVAAIVLPWQLYIFHYFPLEASWEASYNLKHIHEAVEGHRGDAWYYIQILSIHYDMPIHIAILWFLWQLYKHRDFKRFVVVFWALVPIIIFSFMVTKMPCYILFVAPALLFIYADFIVMLSTHPIRDRYRWIVNLILILLLALPIIHCIDRVKPLRSDRNPSWVVDLKALNKRHIPNGVLLNYRNPIAGMFYTDLIVYDGIPIIDSIVAMQRAGRLVMVNDYGGVPDSIWQIPHVRRVSLPCERLN